MLGHGRIIGVGMHTHKHDITENLCVYEVDSLVEGPVVAITANVHGDECTGVAVVHQLLEDVSYILRGKLLLFSSLNPLGLQNMSRQIPGQQEDLNRVFPGDAYGEATEKHAHTIWNTLEQFSPSVLIDIHTDSGNAIPYVLVDRCIHTNIQLVQQTWEMAEHSGYFHLWEYPLAEYKRFSLEKSLAGAGLNHLRIPSLTLEIGPRRYLHPVAVRQAVSAVWRMLGYWNMVHVESLEDMCKVLPVSQAIYGVWRRANGPSTKVGGLIFPLVEVGKLLHKGTAIAKILHSNGQCINTIFADKTMVILAFPDAGYVRDWACVCTIAVPEE